MSRRRAPGRTDIADPVTSQPSPPADEATLQRAYASLVRDMHLALLSEIGARSMYDHLSRHTRDTELRALLIKLNQEGVEAVAQLQELMRGMGGRPRRTSFRRRALARVLALASRVVGPRLVLRICLNAEDTVARWYLQYQGFLLSLGDSERAEVCHRLALTKQLHAQALGAWVTNYKKS